MNLQELTPLEISIIVAAIVIVVGVVAFLLLQKRRSHIRPCLNAAGFVPMVEGIAIFQRPRKGRPRNRGISLHVGRAGGISDRVDRICKQVLPPYVG